MRNPQVAMFNPNPKIEHLRLANGGVCHVIDDALLEPERIVEAAAAQRDAFRPIDFNAYPGNYLLLPAALQQALQDFFNRHIRALFDARRLMAMHSRLAMVTLRPDQLRPCQWICHNDNPSIDRSHSIQASVLYLFRDTQLGGTSFYEPARSIAEARQLFADSMTLSNEAFTERYGIQPGYIHASNQHFTQVGSVPARWNRMIFYDGSLLHSGDIFAPEKLSADPRTGRLTLNGFFTCRRNAR
ncbi:MAG: DUF6445 family protein [Rhodanobacter sp.]